jgi:uncharacterized PurR-regulated membrane protein YhhQ (DUF165 family)
MSVTVDTEAAASGLVSDFRLRFPFSFAASGIAYSSKVHDIWSYNEMQRFVRSAHLHYITVASAAVRTLPVTCGSITRHVEWQMHANHC